MWNTSLQSNMNFPAPIAVLGFLAAGGGLALVLLGILVAYFVRKPKFAVLFMKLTAAAAAIYFGLLLGFSLGSLETTLAPGRRKILLRDRLPSRLHGPGDQGSFRSGWCALRRHPAHSL